jgi:HemY protein
LHAGRDPVWVADGFVSERWMAVSPVSGRLDAFEWKVPLAEIAGPSLPDLEPLAEETPPVIEAVTEPEKPAPPDAIEAETVAAPLSPAPAEKPKPRARKPAAVAAPAKIDAVIPLVHAPDDPGPDAEPEPEPTPEKTDEGWRIPRPFSR